MLLNRRNAGWGVLAVGIVLFESCTTYYISVASLKQQFAGIDSSKLKDVVVQGPAFEKYYYKANPITAIRCTDDHNIPYELENKPSIEMRITYGYKSHRTIFYFDRVFLTQNTMIGVESRFISAIRKTIPLDSITRIEVQDGHKRFTYVNK
jgi:hypothetical protein